MHHNPNYDPRYRQYQLEWCREQLNNLDGFHQNRMQFGHQEEHPVFDELGRVINMPPNMPRAPQNFCVGNQGAGNFIYDSSLWDNYIYHPVQSNPNLFSMSYSVTEHRNSVGRSLVDRLRGHPSVPINVTPKQLVFVYEKPEHLVIPQNFLLQPRTIHRPRPRMVNAAVGDFSVVRYNVETQTEWVEAADKERNGAPPSPADNVDDSSKPITAANSKAPAVGEYVDEAPTEAELLEFKQAMMKVAIWLHNSPTQRITEPVQSDSELPHGIPSEEGDVMSPPKEDVLPAIVRHSHVDTKMKSAGTPAHGPRIQALEKKSSPAAVEATPNTAASSPGIRGNLSDIDGATPLPKIFKRPASI